MPPKEPSRYQLSSRLTFNQDTPAFLQRLKNKVAGVSNDEDEDFDEWQAASGRPPIPRRPTPPERPADEPGSADEEDDDEKPQVVVLREGKHLTAREAENERRKGMCNSLCHRRRKRRQRRPIRSPILLSQPKD